MACSGVLSSSSECLATCEWAGCMVPLFRVHVGDFEDPPTWSDARATEILTAAAYAVYSDILDCYTVPLINICDGSFNTNPFLNAPFINLWLLKSACIVDRGLIRTRALTEGLRAVCGPASLQVAQGSSTYGVLFNEGACAAYSDLVENLCFKNPIQTASNCRQIVSTFVSEYYYRGCNNGVYLPNGRC